MVFDSSYLILLVPAVLLSLYAQFKVQSTFKKYLSVNNSKGLTGAMVARTILDRQGMPDVEIELVEGYLSDHYDPQSRTVRLSPEVYNGTSVSSLGVAAHETGHAIQHGTRYLPLSIRSILVPIANIGSWIAIPLIILGLIIQQVGLVIFGIIIFSMAVAFQLITLPVEINASKRALAILSDGFLTPDELKHTKEVLSAASMTYVAAGTVAFAEFLKSILQFFNSRND